MNTPTLFPNCSAPGLRRVRASFNHWLRMAFVLGFAFLACGGRADEGGRLSGTVSHAVTGAFLKGA